MSSNRIRALSCVAIAMLLSLLITSCSLHESEHFNPRVYTELERPSTPGALLLGEPAAETGGSLQCSQFTKDPTYKDMLVSYVNVTPEQWQRLLDRSGFAAKDATTTPAGPMIFVTIDSVMPLAGADAVWLAMHAIAGPNPGPEAETKSALRFLKIVGIAQTSSPTLKS